MVLENTTLYNETIQMLEYAVDEANANILRDSGMELDITIEKIAVGREYVISKRVCNLLKVTKSTLQFNTHK